MKDKYEKLIIEIIIFDKEMTAADTVSVGTTQPGDTSVDYGDVF